MPAPFVQNVPVGPYATDQQEILRRQRLAQMLQQQAMQPIDAPPQGAFAAPISPLQVGAKLFQGYQAGQLGKQAEEKQKSLAEKMQTDRQQAFANALRASQEQPAQPMQMDAADNVQTPAVPAMPADPARGLAELAKSPDPATLSQYAPVFNMQQAQLKQKEEQKFRAQESAEARASRESMATEAREQRAFDAAAQRAQRMQELTMRMADHRMTEQDRADLRRELAANDAALKRELAALTRSTSPQAIKEREKDEGKTSLGRLLNELEGEYTAYQKLGADIDPSRNSLGNIANRVAASGVGQLVGGAVGTKEQEIRDSINQKRASLMAALKQATGMSATQMNSNVELQFYLKMATDPTVARSANKSAIKWLRDTYGMQGGAAAAPAPAPAPAPTPSPGAPRIVDW